MPDKLMRLRRSEAAPEPPRPVMLAIAGDSAAGKTTLTRGIAEALGGHCVSLRRTEIGPFSVDEADPERIVTPEDALARLS